MINNTDAIKHAFSENEKPTRVFCNSYRGELLEFYDSCSLRFVKQTLFWEGSGYFPEHKHPNDATYYKVLKGRVAYIINNKQYEAIEGDSFTIPKNMFHIDPYNIGMSGATVLMYVTKNKLVPLLENYLEYVGNGFYEHNRNALPDHKRLNLIEDSFKQVIQFKNLTPLNLFQLLLSIPVIKFLFITHK